MLQLASSWQQISGMRLLQDVALAVRSEHVVSVEAKTTTLGCRNTAVESARNAEAEALSKQRGLFYRRLRALAWDQLVGDGRPTWGRHGGKN